MANAPSLAILAEASPRLNFAFHHNAIPFLHRLTIRNSSPEDYVDLTLRLTPEPAWGNPLEVPLAALPAGREHVLVDPQLELNFSFLAELSEKVRGHLRLTLEAKSPDGEIQSLASTTVPLEIYAFDEWTGWPTLPELITSFVTPNLTMIAHLLRVGSDFLSQRTGSGSWDGYQSRQKARIYAQVEAIFAALQEWDVRYCEPPASFGESGQRVRFASEIKEHRLATCLDTSLLFAAALEQAGLRPFLFFHQGHAYAGCWLIEESLTETVTDDLQMIRKRVELDEILVFETTAVCSGQRQNLGAAEKLARAHLSRDAIFIQAIDVHRCRRNGFLPLPLQREASRIDPEAAQAEQHPPRSAASAAPIRPLLETVSSEPETASGSNRIDQWKQRLLDLTLRNRLLNFRETKQTLPLVGLDPARLESALAEQVRFRLLPRSRFMDENDPRSAPLLAQREGSDPWADHIEEEFASRRLRSSLTETECARRLLEIYRQSRSEMEESGANTLFLALGFLQWKESPASDRSSRAPLLLIPVELERPSVQQGFQLKRLDEDALINVTLLELLRRDFQLTIPGINPPPEGETGIDVERVFLLFKQAIREIPGWEVHPEIWLGRFSFSKFLLWKDLADRMDLLTRNPVVHHLVNHPGETFPESGSPVAPQEVDQTVHYEELFCPLSTDSSQLAAILEAARGRNFVLHGPPGTGKSQTITNLIAHCLCLGKRVLFVAEKKAALEVVYRRLTQIGLGSFCLELHSHRSGKTEVLQQFGEALDFGQETSPAEWTTLARRLEDARDGLNAIVAALHHPYPNGLSAYQGYAWLIAHGSPEGEHWRLDLDQPENQSPQARENLVTIAQDLILRGSPRRLPPAAFSALAAVGQTIWTPDWEDHLMGQIDQLEPLLAKLSTLAGQLPLLFPDGHPGPFRQGWIDLIRLAELILAAPTVPSAFLLDPGYGEFRTTLEKVIATGQRRDQARAALDAFSLDDLRNYDLAQAHRTEQELDRQTGLLVGIKRWWHRRPLKRLRVPKSSPWQPDEPFFQTALTWQKDEATVAALDPDHQNRLGSHWAEGEPDWDALAALLQWGDELLAALNALTAGQPTLRQTWRDAIAAILPHATPASGQAPELAADLKIFVRDGGEFLTQTEQLEQAIKLDPAELPNASLYPQRWSALSQNILNHRGDLPNWCRWREARQRAKEAGMAPLLEAMEEEKLAPEDLPRACTEAYYQTFLRRLLNLSPLLRDFWGDEHENRIRSFQDLDDRYTSLTAQTIRARLATGLPRARGQESPKNSELGILQRERAKKGRHKPVRRLLNEIPHLAPALKPCFLMSPLSVAQYLEPGAEPFDLVIFDEASQIPVWDAIGAIARGQQLIVVGDPKQLPPTNFFNREEDETEIPSEEGIVDLESILDECLGSGLPTTYLQWHYRSRREGLIAFSNQQYYDNRLYTFPAPDCTSSGVRFEYLADGVYDKGKSRTNPVEAEAIKKEVIRRLTDPELSRYSLGIVTFSQAQQNLVLDKLDEARREHPAIETFFDPQREEPVFVKNLENVQGDERDIILFSICYGPDAAGKVSMNFGPLNRDGGERRLNVAVTRAKEEVIVFTSLKGEQIDLNRTGALGVAHLKFYLEYAEQGPEAFAARITPGSADAYDSVFEKEVANFLRAEGFTVQTQVGCSGYRLDLALVDPENPGRYLLAVECDGATYHRSPSARDRDRLRQMVLEGLGWRIVRLWSTDWWRNRSAAEETLRKRIEEVLALPRDLPPAPRETPAPAPPPPPAAAPAADAETVFSPHEKPYPVTPPQPEQRSEKFYEPATQKALQKRMRAIIATEGPLTETLLFRRVLTDWGFTRSGQKIRTILQNNKPTELIKTHRYDEPVYWPEGVDPEAFTFYRIPTADPESRRGLEEIPFRELENAFFAILENFLTLPEEDLFRETARRFGINRLTQTARERLEPVLQKLLEKGSVEQINDRLRRVNS